MLIDIAAPADHERAEHELASHELADHELADHELADFVLPAEREAHDPPVARGLARDSVRLLVSRRASGEVRHHAFTDLPGLLLPGDLLVVNTTGTLPAQVRAAGGLAVHFSTARPDGSWLVELRQVKDKISMPNGRGHPGQDISDRPRPESVVPAFVRLISQRLPSGRYRAAELMPAARG